MQKIFCQWLLLFVLFMLFTACGRATKDELKPLLTLTGETQRTISAKIVTVEGQLSDNIKVASFTYSLNQGKAQDVMSSLKDKLFSFSVPDLQDGLNNVVITAKDMAGNQSELELKISVEASSVGTLPQLSGVWGNQQTPYSYCGDTVDFPLVISFIQDGDAVTGSLKMGFPGNYLEGTLTGEVMSLDHVQGSLTFATSRQNQTGSFDLQLEQDTLTGSLTFNNVPSCDGVTVQDFVMQVSLKKGVDLPAPPVDDVLEPNDKKEQASPIDANSSHDLILTYSNLDWFSFTLDKAQNVTVKATNSSTGLKNITLIVFDKQGNYVQVSRSGESSLSLWLKPGAYDLLINMSDGSILATNYNLDLRTADVPDALYEPNDTREKAIAVTLPFAQTLFLTDQDQDWFQFDVAQAGLLSVQNSDGIQAVIYNENFILVSESYRETNPRAYKIGLDPGHYYILLGDMMFANQSKFYHIQLNLESFPDQDFEPNDSFNSAKPITLPFDQALYMTKSDEDWFKFSVTSEQLLLFGADIPASNCFDSYSIQLFDANGSLLKSSSFRNSFDKFQSTDAHVLGTGTYYMKVSNENTLQPCASPYQLRVMSEGFVDANLEPNNAKEQAIAIDFGFNRDIVVTHSDEDWFRFTLTQPTQIKLSLKGLTMYYMQISLSREDDTQVSFSYETIDGYSVATPILTAGTYYVKANLYFGGPTASKSQIKFEKK
jgi:hypothetical protein